MILFYLLIATMPFVQHPVWGRFISELTMTKYLGAACLLYSIGYLLRRRTVPAYLGTWAARWFVCFFVLAIVSFATNGTTFSWQHPIVSYSSFLLLFFITVTVVDSYERLRWVLLVAIGAVTWAALYMIREWQQAVPLYGIGYRPGWVTGDANFFSVSAVVALPLCVGFVLHPSHRWEKQYAGTCAVITLFAVTITASRGGFIALLAAGLFFVWTTQRRFRALAVSAVLVCASLLAIPSSPVHRLLAPNYSDTESSDLRFQLWRAGTMMVVDHPFTGVGLGQFAAEMKVYGLDPEAMQLHVPHNTFLHVASEMGLPSLLLFVAMISAAFRTLSRIRAHASFIGDVIVYERVRGIQAGLAGYAIAAVFISAQQAKLFWLMLFLSCSLQQLLIAELNPISRRDTTLQAQTQESAMSCHAEWK